MTATSENRILGTRINDKPIHCRSYTKQDGRNLWLYGYEAHSGNVVEGEQPQIVSGSEMRLHPLRNSWSVYASGRNKRTFKPSAADDPLAPTKIGNPHTEIPFTDFQLAVFENRFPAFRKNSASGLPPVEGVRAEPADGACEVIVYSPEAKGSLASLGQDKRRLILTAWIDRYDQLYKQDFAYVLPFENRGNEVGVTLHHPHGQIYALPVIPEPQLQAATAFSDGYDLAGQLTDWRTDYFIEEAGGIAAFAPPFGRFPYEVWLAPIDPVPGPWAFNETQADGFAHLLGSITQRYDRFFGQETPYMLSLQAAPRGVDQSFQFTAQFYPLLRAPGRVKYFAALEQVTGLFTVDVMPNDAAAALRVAI